MAGYRRVVEAETGAQDPPPYLDYNTRLIELIGVWRERGPCGVRWPRLSLFCLYVFVIYCVILSGSVLELLHNYSDLEVVTECLSGLFSYGVNCHKLLILIVFEKDFKHLLKLVKCGFRNPRQPNSPYHQQVLARREWESRMLTYFFATFVFVASNFLNLYPLAEWYLYQEPNPELAANGTSSYEWRFPYRLRMPFDVSAPAVFWSVYLYHCSIGCLHWLVMPGTDNFYIALLNHAYGQSLLLRHDLQSLRAGALRALADSAAGDADPDAGLHSELGPLADAWRREYARLLGDAVGHHKTVLEFIERLEMLINKPMLSQFFTSSIVLCTTAFQILMFPTDTVKIVGMAAFCVGEGVQLWMYCYLANKITAEMDAVGDSAYFSEWYEAGAPAKRSLGILMTRANKHTPFTVGKFTELSLGTFASILKGSYTYLMLLTEIRK